MRAPEPPAAPRRPTELTAHGHTRIDDWHWLRGPDDPDVIAYLEAENRYTDEVLAPTRPLQDDLFEGIRSRVHETDTGPPARHLGYWYYSRTFEGRQYPVSCRLPDPDGRLEAADVARSCRAGTPADEQVILDENEIAGDGGYLSLGVFDVSPDQTCLAYAPDLDGSELHTLRFRDLTTGLDLDDKIDRIYYGSAWSADSRSLFYIRPDESMRPWQIWCHNLGTAAADDRLVHQEDDERFFLDVALSRSGRRIVIHSASKTSSETYWIDAGRPDDVPTLLLAREPGIEHDVEHAGDGWLVLSNRPDPDGTPSPNFALWRAQEATPGAGMELVVPHRPDVKLEGVDAFRDFTVVAERSCTDGLERLQVLTGDGASHVIDQPEAVYSLLGGHNPDFDQGTYRFGYTSLATPRTSVDYDVAARRRTAVWTQAVGGGYEPGSYRTERVWATAPDGERVPVSLLCRADHRCDGTAPVLLYGYGAYEASMDPTFSPSRLNLVDRGAVYAVAHIRGGGELGRRWYEEGRMEHKANTFSDFIAAAECLVSEGWADGRRMVARGGSAGGLLMGAVTNLRPELWRAVVAEVPFVDVVTTMSDPSLPLTVTEWEEWGNPLDDPAAYHRMLAYSPYDNVRPQHEWPALYVTAGLNDPRVGFWEPAKWVARMRAAGAGRAPDRPLLLEVEMGAGHQGPSGRYDAWRDEARIQAFVLTQMGLA